jgi:hypothetical protein
MLNPLLSNEMSSSRQIPTDLILTTDGDGDVLAKLDNQIVDCRSDEFEYHTPGNHQGPML